MSSFTFQVVGHQSDWRWFREVADALAATLEDLGHDVTWNHGPPGTTIVFNAHKAAEYGWLLPAGSVLYNLEQMTDGGSHSGDAIVELFSKHTIWDYSPNNVDWWKRRGISSHLVPVGGHPVLQRIARSPQPDIDVLMYGSRCARRERVEQNLRASGLNVVALHDVWGKQRDAFIARAKVVLNVHHWDEVQRLEVARIVYLLCNGVCVVSETGDDERLERMFDGGVAFASYDCLVERCAQLARGTRSERDAISSIGFARASEVDVSGFVRAALSETRVTK